MNFWGSEATPKIHPKITQNDDVVGGLKKPPYLCTTSGEITVLIIYAPRMNFWGSEATPKIHPKIT